MDFLHILFWKYCNTCINFHGNQWKQTTSYNISCKFLVWIGTSRHLFSSRGRDCTAASVKTPENGRKYWKNNVTYYISTRVWEFFGKFRRLFIFTFISTCRTMMIRKRNFSQNIRSSYHPHTAIALVYNICACGNFRCSL